MLAGLLLRQCLPSVERFLVMRLVGHTSELNRPVLFPKIHGCLTCTGQCASSDTIMYNKPIFLRVLGCLSLIFAGLCTSNCYSYVIICELVFFAAL